MADLDTLRRPALAALNPTPHGGPDAPVRLREIPHVRKVNLRGDPQDRGFLAAVGAALDLVLPTEPNMSAVRDGVAALWLGPDEWLLTGEVSPIALEEHHASAVDVTDNSTILRLAGPRARDVLAKGCPLDFHPSVFPVGEVAQSLIGPVDVIIHQVEADGFDLHVRRSFAEYLWLWLEDSGLEYSISTGI